MSSEIWTIFKLQIKFSQTDGEGEFPTVMKIGYDVENTETLVCFLMGERLKKKTRIFYLIRESIYALLYHLLTNLLQCVFSTSLVYPVPVNSRMNVHKYDSPHYLYSPISISLVNYVYQDLLTECVELDWGKKDKKDGGCLPPLCNPA